MDGIGNEIGLKMRSAIKAKLTELGCYVDDELPDYVMVMVANKRTRAQMEDDLQLFLGDNTEMFVNWLHQVLKKLQEVTVTPLKAELEKKKERSGSKERKVKDKKDKVKTKKGESSKKSKKKEKEKARKKEEKKSSKSKKKSKHEMIRPNIPPLLMNIEKDSEPSITDVFAGQILKNHGINLESYKDDLKVTEIKMPLAEIKRPILPIIDPATISTQSEDTTTQSENNDKNTDNIINNAPKPSNSEDNIQEMNMIEAKIQGLRQKLVEQLDSMSDDEDFLNIRTEAEELMNDFAEDVLQEISQPPPPVTPPLRTNKTLYPIQKPIPEIEKPKDIQKEPEILPQIELNLPKRPIRERLGARDVPPVQEVKEKESPKKPESPERFTPEKDIEFRPKARSSRSRIGSQSDSQKKPSVSEDIHEKESSSKRLTSKVSAAGRRGASVGRVRPRPRVGAPASSLLLRAVADAHKSLLNIPPKIDHGSQKIKRALVLPMRRCMENQKIVIQVPGDTHSDRQGDAVGSRDTDDEGDKNSKNTNEDELASHSITKVIHNINNKGKRTTSRLDDDVMDTITIHNTTVDKDKGTQFIVTMDGYHPNAFLAKKLLTEGILDEDDEKETTKLEQKATQKQTKDTGIEKQENSNETGTSINLFKKRLSNTSEESNTQVIIKQDHDLIEKRKSTDEIESVNKPPPVKKRKASPIIFDVDKKEKDRVRERSVSASSDSHVTLISTSTSHKYDDLPPLSQAERKTVWCRSFPLCRFGSACAFQHPRCKFAAACTRRACGYAHAPDAPDAPPAAAPPAAAPPLLASHVVPAANYKSISAVVPPSMCRFYPNCVNPTCHYYHPKPCRFGKACTNKLECNFYHNDVPSKWKYSV